MHTNLGFLCSFRYVCFPLLKRRDATSSCSKKFRLLAWDQLPPIVEGRYRTKFQLLNVRPRSAQGFHSNYKMYDNVWNYYTLQDTTTSSSWSWKVSLSNCLKLCRPDLTLRWHKKRCGSIWHFCICLLWFCEPACVSEPASVSKSPSQECQSTRPERDQSTAEFKAWKYRMVSFGFAIGKSGLKTIKCDRHIYWIWYDCWLCMQIHT